MKNLKKKFDHVEISGKFTEIGEDRTIEDLKKEYPDKDKNLEKVLPNYMDENDLKSLKTGFPDKWKYLTQNLAYSYEFFNGIEDYQKPVDNLKKENFFSELKSNYPDDEEMERIKEIFKRFIIKNGEEPTNIYLKRS